MKRYVKTNYVFDSFKMAKQQQTTQTVMYSTFYKAGWPKGLRRQRFLVHECVRGFESHSCQKFLSICEVSHELKTMQNQKQFCVWKPSGIKTRLKSSRSRWECARVQNVHLSGQKNRTDASLEMHFFAMTALVVDDQLLIWKMKFQKIEEIFQNKLRIWTVQNGKTTQTVMYRTIYMAGWPRGLRRQTQENFSFAISGPRMCAGSNPLRSEVFRHCEVSHELKTMQNQKQFCFWKPSGIRTRLKSSPSKFLLHQSVLGFKTYPCQNRKIKMMHLVKCTFLHWQNWLSMIN